MRRFTWSISAGLAITVILAIFSNSIDVSALWGLSAYNYLSLDNSLIIPAAFALVTAVLLFSITLSANILERFDNVFFAPSLGGRIAIAVIGMIVFWLLRAETHFLGDGYTILSLYGNESGVYSKWTEWGSTWLVGNLVALVGGRTDTNALLVFRWLSIASGGIVVFNFLSIVRLMFDSPRSRVLAALTIFGSGAMALFSGYVEFYPLLWAAATTFLHFSVLRLTKGGYVFGVLISYAVSVAIHLQSAWLFGGFLFVLFISNTKGKRKTAKKLSLLTGVGLVIAAVAAYLYLSSANLDVQTILLPLWHGRPASPEYSILSLQHLADLANLCLLLFPALPAILGLTLVARNLTSDNIIRFLCLCSIGGLLFLLLIDPRLGLARDWDLFSFTLFCPMLLLLYVLRGVLSRLSAPVIISYGLISLSLSLSFVTVSTQPVAAADRFHDLLRHYGAKDRAGWQVLSDYYDRIGDFDMRDSVARESDDYFPEYRSFYETRQLVFDGKYVEALSRARALVHDNPYEADFRRLLAEVYSRMKEFDSAAFYYQQAIRLRPHYKILTDYGRMLADMGKLDSALTVLRRAQQQAPHVDYILEGIGLVYVRMNEIDSAATVANRLLADDSTSAVGHLIALVCAVQRHDRPSAIAHYKAFVEYGHGRADYDNVRARFGFLNR